MNLSIKVTLSLATALLLAACTPPQKLGLSIKQGYYADRLCNSLHFSVTTGYITKSQLKGDEKEMVVICADTLVSIKSTDNEIVPHDSYVYIRLPISKEDAIPSKPTMPCLIFTRNMCP